MDIELMKQERMGVEGKGILRSLQNDSLPLIDLLIREALQNSLDAAKKNAEEIYVDVGICNFKSELLAENLSGISEHLKYKYNNKNTKAIYVSDKNTIGLIGDVRKKTGNIYNLIYTIQRNQEQEGAGGSWGLGKTSYFRVGNGIVLYYSRIKLDNGNYEERLAGSLIEDSTKKDKILNNSRGIAWWGKKDNGKKDDFESTYPITDSEEISKILNIFNIKPYEEKETGTTIIIPFIDEKRLLPVDEDENRGPRWWETSLEKAVEIAVQKWYAPRIFNLDYDGAYLIPSINGEILTPNEFQPFFKKIHELYISGIKNQGTGNIKVDTIELKNRGISSHKGTAGWLAHGLYSKENLNMTPPNNEVHPLEYFGYTNLEELENTNAKIVAYARKPGMIVEYDINGEWSKKTTAQENEFIIGFFLPNSKGKLYEKFIEPEVENLEDYLRKTEKSDHAEWEDITLNNTKVTIVSRIMRNVSKAMEENYNQSEDNTFQSKASILGKKIGDKLLPKNGIIGKRAVEPNQKKTGAASGRNSPNKRKTSIEVTTVSINKSQDLIVGFILNIQKESISEVSVNLRIGTTSYDEIKWKKDMGVSSLYPFLIKEVFIDYIEKDSISLSADDFKDERLSVRLTSFGNASSFEVQNNCKEEVINVEGKITIKVNDDLMQPVLTVSEVQ